MSKTTVISTDTANFFIYEQDKEIEKYLHEVFKDRLFTEYDREWFKLDEECLFFFKKVKTVVEH